jgi:NAD(P)H-nitrite reductase large subunit
MLKDGEKGAVLQRDKKSYAIVPHLPLGLITPQQLRKIADVAEKYQSAAIKVTSAARIAIVGLKEEEIDQAWRDLDMTPGAAVGLCVRSIKTCPGNTLCRLGQQNSMGLAGELDRRYHGYELPGKVKMPQPVRGEFGQGYRLCRQGQGLDHRGRRQRRLPAPPGRTADRRCG